MEIIYLKAREILDSRGFPTIEVDLKLNNGGFGRASIPSGTSTGSNEALELRDNDNRFLGKGVSKAVANVNDIIYNSILNKEFNSFRDLDHFLIELDGTSNKSNLGANAILGVSLAFIKAISDGMGMELYQFIGKEKTIPTCMFNILNGGLHASNKIDFQEFMILVKRDSINDQLRIASEVFHTLQKILIESGYSSNVGDEGGFAPNVSSNDEALNFIVDAILKANYVPGKDVFIALDVAASSFYDKEKDMYLINSEYYDFNGMIDIYKNLIDKYPIISIEDPLFEEDFEGFSKLTSELGIRIVGDDLFTTNVSRLKKGILLKACNSILLKANQIGTVSEMLDAIDLAKNNGYDLIISHRSGETEDTFISDFAVGLGIPFMKSGSVSRGERICKYNRLIRIEEEL